MSYAKISADDDVLVFPYTMETLKEENPYTEYDNRFDLIGWYEQTEEAIDTGNKIVPVEVEEPPHLDDYRLQLSTVSETPVLENGVWVLKYLVRDRTTQELAEYDLARFNDPQKSN